MRILLLTHYFPPDSPGQIPEAIAKELQSRSHDVKVLTTFPHYDTGKIAEGYKQRLNHVEEFDGIPVQRVPIYPSHSKNPIGRIANYLSFVWMARFAGDFVDDADVIYVHGTPATVAAPARYWGRKLGIPFVFHVQDLWPESVTRSGFLPKPVSTIADFLLGRWLKGIYSSAAAVIAISPTAAQLLVQRGVSQGKCHIVFNWSNDEGASPKEREEPGPGLTLLYAGNLGSLQDLETVIKAVHRLGSLPGIRLLIAGSGTHEKPLRKLVEALKAQSVVHFLGRLPRHEMSSLYREADFQVVPLKDIDIFAGTIPSKLQNGLAHGLPVITTVKGDVTSIVEQHQLGFTAPPGDVNTLADAIVRAYFTTSQERMVLSQRARSYYESNFAPKEALDRIEQILRTVSVPTIQAESEVPGNARLTSR